MKVVIMCRSRLEDDMGIKEIRVVTIILTYGGKEGFGHV
jgi:hypothetical protein